MRIGIVGASGFVGRRAVEMLPVEGTTEVCPIVHSQSSLEKLAQYKLDGRIANSFDQSSLESAFQGCDAIIQSILGTPGLIRGTIVPTYKAAQKAGVRRIIYLSSMIVHTSAPAPGTTEATPPITNQPGFPTHIAKIDAERQLLQLHQTGSVEVVIFRPGIVFGPRSRWVTELADQLVNGRAYLIDGGKGICNSVYVDNLIHAMRLALTAKDADGEAFFAGDSERVTWLDFYRPFAEAFGVDPTQLPSPPVPEFTHSRKQELIGSIRESVFVQKTLAMIPEDLKQKLKRSKSQPQQPAPEPKPEPVPVVPAAIPKGEPVVTEMMSILQQSQYQLPFTKAEKLLGYEPIVSFDEGCRRSIEWLSGIDRFKPFLKK
ncbi:NAD(P)-dependent oxidoreductase [Phormidium sp. LEGE 05292]|uniref:NAD-dependent epimerase/dehydratase family protein n=1 Tax=[Phormidium] sp. LEGE 05292 TaxID=767427 RepID=UPI001881EE1A|nr:NAD(P)-dependent oxidoreductase [Phormidium sp. LEGE 05292]MBE9226322.1 NAD(P)-dependent oxidoreductase [Phormidium sp. LEGE 05292]